MASKTLIDIAIRLGQQLGANTSKFLGTRSNVSFLGSGPKDGMLFQKAINPNAFLKIGVEKVLPDIESSLAYASGGKLNDLQMNKLIDNLNKMLEVQGKLPKVPGTGGLGSLEDTAKVFDLKGKNIKNPQNIMGGEEIIETSSVLPGPAVRPMSTREKFIQASKDGTLNRQKAVDLSREAGMTDKLSPAPKQEGNKYSKAFAAASGLDMQGKPLTQVYKNIAKLKAQDTGKQTAGGELLLNVFQGQKFIPRDVKGFLQSGNQGDSIKIVEKYFGPKVADLVPLGATAEEMSIFTQRVLNNLVDAKGFRPGDPKFNRLTADFVEKTFASGGRVGFSNGGLAKILEL
tara:strand:- start:309 stop:1343 length:1035 start_codon:yes stop_codon:yes gene_type:complete